MKELFYMGKRPTKRIFMKGDAGCGKTIFCLKLLDTWCQVKQSGKTSDDVLQKCLSVFDLVFFILLRQCARGWTSVEDMICDSVSTGYPEMCHRIKSLLGSRDVRCLILLDGLDEWYLPHGFRGLPDMYGLANSVLVCTMRPWMFAHLQLKLRPDDKVVQILGRLPKSVKKVIEFVLSNLYGIKKGTSTFESKLKRYSRKVKNSKLGSLIRIPMMLTALCYMWYEEDLLIEKNLNEDF